MNVPTCRPSAIEQLRDHARGARLAVRAGDVDRPGTPPRASRGTATARRCARGWARRVAGSRGVPTPVSRLTCESSHSREPGTSVVPLTRRRPAARARPSPRARVRSSVSISPAILPARTRRRARASSAASRSGGVAHDDPVDRRRERHLLLRLLLAHRAEHFAGNREHERIAAVRGRTRADVRPRGAVDRAVLPPRPHFFGDERQERREQAQQRGERGAQGRAPPSRSSASPAPPYAAALHELDVVVAERPEEPLGAFERRGRSRTRRTRRSLRRRRSASVASIDRSSGSVTAPRSSVGAGNARARTSTRSGS